MNLNMVVEYIGSLNPTTSLEMVRISNDVKVMAQVLIEFMERANASRQVKLWEQENRKLQEEINKLVQDIEKARELDGTYKELTLKKDKLLIEKNEIQDLIGQREEIEQLVRFVSQYDLSFLQQELKHVKTDNTDNLLLIQEWITVTDRFLYDTKGNFLKETRALLEQMNKNREELNVVVANFEEALKLNCLEMSRLLETYSGELKTEVKRYNDVVEQLAGIKAKLEEIRRNHTKNVQTYQTHFSQNQAIWGELGKRHRLDEQLSELFKTIENNLFQFDQEIKNVIEKTDHIIVY